MDGCMDVDEDLGQSLDLYMALLDTSAWVIIGGFAHMR